MSKMSASHSATAFPDAVSPVPYSLYILTFHAIKSRDSVVIKYNGKCTIRHVAFEGTISDFVTAKGRSPTLYCRGIYQASVLEYFDTNVKFFMT